MTGAARTACERLVAGLPDRLHGRRIVERDPGVPGATWGDPAIELRCGVGLPEKYTPVSTCVVVRGLGWFIPEDVVADQSRDVVMTSISRTPYVEVRVPARYRPPVDVFVDLAAVIRANTAPTPRCAG